MLQRDGRVQVGAHLHAREQLGLRGREIQPDRTVRDLRIRTGQAQRERAVRVLGHRAGVDVVRDFGPLVDDLRGRVRPGRDRRHLEQRRCVLVDRDPRLGVHDVEVRVHEGRRCPRLRAGQHRRVVLDHVVVDVRLGEIHVLLPDHQKATERIHPRIGELLHRHPQPADHVAHHSSLVLTTRNGTHGRLRRNHPRRVMLVHSRPSDAGPRLWTTEGCRSSTILELGPAHRRPRGPRLGHKGSRATPDPGSEPRASRPRDRCHTPHSGTRPR